jgi:hypothetical protein
VKTRLQTLLFHIQLVPLHPGGEDGQAPLPGVGLYALTPPDPQLKGAWYQGGFNPCTYEVKTRFQFLPF